MNCLTFALEFHRHLGCDLYLAISRSCVHAYAKDVCSGYIFSLHDYEHYFCKCFSIRSPQVVVLPYDFFERSRSYWFVSCIPKGLVKVLMWYYTKFGYGITVFGFAVVFLPTLFYGVYKWVQQRFR